MLSGNYSTSGDLNISNGGGRTLSRAGASVVMNQSIQYSSLVNRPPRSKQEYGDILREQMRTNEELKQSKKQRSYNQPQQQQQAPISTRENFESASNNIQAFQNNKPSLQPNLSQPGYTPDLLQMFSRPRQEYASAAPLVEQFKSLAKYQLQQPPTLSSSGSYLDNALMTSFRKENELKQRAKLASLADQISERRVQLAFESKPKPIAYLPTEVVLEEARQKISEKIDQMNNAQLLKLPLPLVPINSYNKNNVLYHELEKEENGYRWRPDGEWSAGRSDLDLIKCAFIGTAGKFQKQSSDLKSYEVNAQRKRDEKVAEVEALRLKVSHNDRARGIMSNVNENNRQSKENQAFEESYLSPGYELPCESHLVAKQIKIRTVRGKQHHHPAELKNTSEVPKMRPLSAPNRFDFKLQLQNVQDQSLISEYNLVKQLREKQQPDQLDQVDNINPILQGGSQAEFNDQISQIVGADQLEVGVGKILGEDHLDISAIPPDQDKEKFQEDEMSSIIGKNPQKVEELQIAASTVDVYQLRRVKSAEDRQSKAVLPTFLNLNNIHPMGLDAEITRTQRSKEFIDFNKIQSLATEKREPLGILAARKKGEEEEFDQLIGDIENLMSRAEQSAAEDTRELAKTDEQMIEAMRFAKLQTAARLASLNKYTQGNENNYINDVFKKVSAGHLPSTNISSVRQDKELPSYNLIQKITAREEIPQINQIEIEKCTENEEFIKNANKIDFLIGKLITYE